MPDAHILQVPVEFFFGFPAPLADDAKLLCDRVSVAVNTPAMCALREPRVGGRSRPWFCNFTHAGMISRAREPEKMHQNDGTGRTPPVAVSASAGVRRASRAMT